MNHSLELDVSSLDALHRRALEDLIGVPLEPNQSVVIHVREAVSPDSPDLRPAQTLEDWTSIYKGLTDAEIDEIDRIIKTRANLTREFP